MFGWLGGLFFAPFRALYDFFERVSDASFVAKLDETIDKLGIEKDKIPAARRELLALSSDNLTLDEHKSLLAKIDRHEVRERAKKTKGSEGS